MRARGELTRARRWVIKIGSTLLTDGGRGLHREAIADWVAQMAELRVRGIEVVLVSSGSVAEGMARLGWSSRPAEIHRLQAAAAVGQMGLVQTYETFFHEHGLRTAQILLVHDDLGNRQRYLNARSTLKTLLELGVVPVINENDTVATDEIRFGDNDTLGALVANLIEADVLVILTDQPGLFARDPRRDPQAPLVHDADANDQTLEQMAGGSGTELGRGGMITKVRAARIAARSGAETVIVGGRAERVLLRVAAGEEIGTWLHTSEAPLAARKRWLAGQLQVRGRLVLDEGAVRVLRESGRSLLPVGVREVHGDFTRGELVVCSGPDGRDVAKGLMNYSATEARRIMGLPTRRIQEELGYRDGEEMIHRDNLVLC
ncbi:MAG TPA: glutamate 5-kinase [Pseudomonadales bacterium]|nr:glutamate 5-kinase [Pseudomonadales bacterium]HND13560.1 glutamate 5-kinase [Pseudomonadales bacterium]